MPQKKHYNISYIPTADIADSFFWIDSAKTSGTRDKRIKQILLIAAVHKKTGPDRIYIVNNFFYHS